MVKLSLGRFAVNVISITDKMAEAYFWSDKVQQLRKLKQPMESPRAGEIMAVINIDFGWSAWEKGEASAHYWCARGARMASWEGIWTGDRGSLRTSLEKEKVQVGREVATKMDATFGGESPPIERHAWSKMSDPPAYIFLCMFMTVCWRTLFFALCFWVVPWGSFFKLGTNVHLDWLMD